MTDMSVSSRPAGRRRHTTGEATRELLMETAERLFALRGVDGVTLREIQVEAGQSNSSVITYHFGSKAGLVGALIDFRYRNIDARRTALLAELHETPPQDLARAAIWVIVRPLLESIEAGEMFVPFLARLSESPSAHSEYWPREFEDTRVDVLTALEPNALAQLPEQLRRGRGVQLYNSVLNLLGEHARRGRTIRAVQLENYVDGWAAMLTAPVSEYTLALLPDSASPAVP